MSCPYDDGSGRAPHPLSPSAESTELAPIPQPPQYLFGILGNLLDIDPSFPSKSIWHLASLYGPIFKLNLSEPVVVVSNQKFINEICDETRFVKAIGKTLTEVRALTGDGLFTAYPEEKNWWIAHRTLVPAFGPLGIRKMFGDMLDISSQMVLKWDRGGPEYAIDCSDELTRLAFDTIGLCAFSYRFNEFYSDHAHPFAQQMAAVLLESGRRASRTSVEKQIRIWSERERQENVSKMHNLADEIVAERRKNPQPDKKDLLNTMITAVDRETGQKLSDENIRFNMITFLVAGHETTSGTLSFCYYNLLKNPEKLHKAQQEVDEVVGNDVLQIEHLPKLTYIDACIKETLRLSSPIGIFTVRPKEDTLLGGRYPVTTKTVIQTNLKGLHNDREVWGDDANVFRPERFLNGGFQALPPNSWKPFGNGMRGCIGRTFAEQEMVMNVALVLQRFQLEFADPAYELQLKSTLTIKPGNFKMKVRRRPGKTLMTGIPGGIPTDIAQKQKNIVQEAEVKTPGSHKSPVTILFGGNSGTCESLAEDLEVKGPDYGLQFAVRSLDSATENIPTDQPVVIITASYEGQPPDNAKKFVTWLEHLDKSPLKGAKYTVFGVGNSDWVATFHRIPKLVDEKLAALGASRFLEAGYTNAKTDLVGPWEDWSDTLLGTLQTLCGSTSAIETNELVVSVSKEIQKVRDEDTTFGTVIINRELVGTEVGPAKRHLEVRLPEGSEYTAGDYLAVIPKNPHDILGRVLACFNLSDSDMISIKGSKKKFLPTEPISAIDLFSSAVELSTPITKRQLETILAHARPEQKTNIEKFGDNTIYQTLLEKRYSIIDVLEELFIDIPLAVYIDMLQPLSPRQYSISSSPLHPTNNPARRDNADIATITFDVLSAPALSGHGIYNGVASTYLASRRPGDRISCFVRRTNVGFRLPANPEIPVIMIAAGTGLAPMRAFIQERAAIAEAGVLKLGPAMLFFGCRHEDKDFLYKDELKEWERKGVVTVKPAFSKMGDKPVYVQDVIYENREEAMRLFQSGGKIFCCGSAARLGKSAGEVCKRIYREDKGCTEEEAEHWLQAQKEDRYVSDVFG
ncbi:hypothetical protein B7494_g5932 [Chlorociboria aeruginascens]|nr:hypothetical protein B7494_g5932 [Chlorociboria aeruginascens]